MRAPRLQLTSAASHGVALGEPIRRRGRLRRSSTHCWCRSRGRHRLGRVFLFGVMVLQLNQDNCDTIQGDGEPRRRPAAEVPVATEPLGQRDGTRPAAVRCLRAAALVWVAGPLFDGDLWWHVRLGQEILDQHRVAGPGPVGRSLRRSTGTWTTTQWLSEVLMATTYRVGGWSALGWLRLVGELAPARPASAWADLRGRGRCLRPPPLLHRGYWQRDLRPGPPAADHVHPVSRSSACAAPDSSPGRVATRRRSWSTACSVWAQFHPGWVLAPGSSPC